MKSEREKPEQCDKRKRPEKVQQTEMQKLTETHTIEIEVSDQVESLENSPAKPYFPCYKQYARMSSLKRHKMSHMEKFKWRECDMSFSEKESLDVHRASHNTKPLFRCNKCGEDFLTYLDHTIHLIRQDHSMKSLRQCNESCNYRVSTLNGHMKIHRDEKDYACSYCEKMFRTRSEADVHERVHMGQKLYPRGNCRKQLALQSNLSRHNVTHTGKKNYKCPVCKKKFKKSRSLTAHVGRKHLPGAKEYAGTKMNNKSASNFEHNQYKRKRSDAEEPVWDEKQMRRLEQVTEDQQTGSTNCEDNDGRGLTKEAFRDQEEVAPNKKRRKAHLREKHKESHEREKRQGERKNHKRSYEMEKIRESDEREEQEKDREREKRKESAKRKRPEEVQQTEMQKPTETQIIKIEVSDQAESLENSIGKPYCCTTCSKQYSTMSLLKRHMKIHMEENKFKCRECDRSFREKRSLYAHRVSHSTKPLFRCEDCDEDFITYSYFDYAIHRRNGHCSKSRYQCDVCGKYLSRIDSLNQHMKIHWNEKDHGCPHCEKMFRTRQQAKVHERVHTGQKPYACENCGKQYSQQSTLNKHMLIHTGEKNFECPVCKGKFKSSISLTAHVGREHLPGAKE